LANRLKLQGFTAEAAYKALCEFSFRPGRTDDYQRIIDKVYFGKGDIKDIAKPLTVWTPATGAAQYQRRGHAGTPELPTGFKAIDAATFGLVRGHIFTVGARTNAGKTTFAIVVARTLCGAGRRVLYVSTETVFEELWDRYAAVSTGISAFQIQHGLVTGPSKERLNSFFEEFKKHQLIVPADMSRPSLKQLRQLIDQSNPDVLVLDYFQHVDGRDTRELEELVMGLKSLAMEKNVAMLVTAQLHDGAVNPKTNKLYPPTLGSMKNCKMLNDESRVVLLLDWERDSSQGDGPVAVKVLMAKNKGTRNDCVLRLDRAVPRFTDDV
jgi:replicative DNA helicase